jgi:hypothetical protein
MLQLESKISLGGEMRPISDITKESEERESLFPFGGLLVAAASGFFFGRLLKRRSSSKAKGWDKQFTGAYPRAEGATSAVTGGPPEDMNEMPATPDPIKEGPIYDGSQL